MSSRVSAGLVQTTTIDLPGDAQLTFNGINDAALTLRYITVVDPADSLVAIRSKDVSGTPGLQVMAAGATFYDAPPAFDYETAVVAGYLQFDAGSGFWVPGVNSAFNNQYLAFAFINTSAGNQLQHGWVEMSLTYSGNAFHPKLTLHRMSYEDSGAAIEMGSEITPVPEIEHTLIVGSAVLLTFATCRRTVKAATAS